MFQDRFRRKGEATEIVLTDVEAATLLNACRIAREKGNAIEIDKDVLKSASIKLGDAYIEGNVTVGVGHGRK